MDKQRRLFDVWERSRERWRRADKGSVRSWDGIVTARCSATGHNVAVRVGRDAHGRWCVATFDDAGGRDEGPARAYPSRELAVAAAERVAAWIERSKVGAS